MSEKNKKYWYQQGVKAGKTEGWMNLEETLEEDRERWPEVKDPIELVQRDIDEWEETDHFQLLYRAKMMRDAEEDAGLQSGMMVNDETYNLYWEYKEEFWEGYLTGRKSIGRDIYAMTRKLISGRSRRKSKVSPSKARKVRTLSTLQGVK